MTQPTEALVIAEPHQPSGTALALIRPIAKPTDLLKLHDEVAAIIQQALTKGVDFDVVPGTGAPPGVRLSRLMGPPGRRGLHRQPQNARSASG